MRWIEWENGGNKIERTREREKIFCTSLIELSFHHLKYLTHKHPVHLSTIFIDYPILIGFFPPLLCYVIYFICNVNFFHPFVCEWVWVSNEIQLLAPTNDNERQRWRWRCQSNGIRNILCSNAVAILRVLRHYIYDNGTNTTNEKRVFGLYSFYVYIVIY